MRARLALASLAVVALLAPMAACGGSKLQAQLDMAKQTLAHEQELRSQHQEIIRRQEAQIHDIQTRIETCQAKLDSAEITNILECQANLAACHTQKGLAEDAAKRLMAKAEESAFRGGMLHVWQALSIETYPETEGSWLFKEHYLTVKIRIRGRDLYSFKVQTKDAESGLTKAFATMADAAALAALLPK